MVVGTVITRPRTTNQELTNDSCVKFLLASDSQDPGALAFAQAKPLSGSHKINTLGFIEIPHPLNFNLVSKRLEIHRRVPIADCRSAGSKMLLGDLWRSTFGQRAIEDRRLAADLGCLRRENVPLPRVKGRRERTHWRLALVDT
jgi:hypothetical protein